MLAAETDRHLWTAPEPPPIFFEARGVAERLLSALGYVACLRRGGSAPYLHPGAAAELLAQGHVVEVDLDALLAANRREFQFREVSREPSIRRDVAVLLDRSQPAGEVVEAVGKVAGADLVSVEIFDRYEGKGVPEGRVSLAFRMVFQRSDRTLTDAEVTKTTNRVIRTLTERFGAELR